jgi:EpsI family protein
VGAIFWAMLGWRTTSIYLIPLVLPLFALPLWSPLTPLLQYLTTQVVSFALSLIGIPIYVEDHFIHIPEGKFSIEEVCAGLRYVLAAVLVALVYVYLHIHQLKSRLLFVGYVILLSLIVNWIRVFVVILAGHLTNMSHSFVTDHADFGWWLFAFTLIPIFWFGGYLVRKEEKTVRRQEPPDLKIQNDTAHNVYIINSSTKFVFSALLIFTLIFPLSGFYLKERNRQILDSPLIDLQAPKPSGQWSGPYEVQQNNVQPVFQGSDREVIASYMKDGNEAILYMAQYLFQEQGKELIAEYNRPYNPSIWRPVSNGKRQIKLHDGSIIETQEIIIKNEQGKTQILWYWYSIAGINTVSPVEAKILQMRDMLLRNRSGSNVILLILNTDRNTDSARNTMIDYYSNMYDALYSTIYERKDFTRQAE